MELVEAGGVGDVDKNDGRVINKTARSDWTRLGVFNGSMSCAGARPTLLGSGIVRFHALGKAPNKERRADRAH